MFNQDNYRMAKAQQERLLAQAEKQDGRRRRSNLLLALIRRLADRGDRRTGAQVKHKPAKV
ncbi:MAG: hypothetical protein R3248_13310 [Candidatus Promineifilaceae bacterium]|nr:hypothetical protein [Candidatus Promineifilaceae bacterium]